MTSIGEKYGNDSGIVVGDETVTKKILTLDEIGDKYSLYTHAKDWLVENASDQDPILIINPTTALGYIDPIPNNFSGTFNRNLALVKSTLGQISERVGESMFYFNSFKELMTARERVRGEIPWAFHYSQNTINHFGVQARPVYFTTDMLLSLNDENKVKKYKKENDTGFFEI